MLNLLIFIMIIDEAMESPRTFCERNFPDDENP